MKENKQTNTLEEQINDLEKEEKEIEEKKQELEKIKEEVEDYEKQKEALEKELQRVKSLLEETRKQKRQENETFQEKFYKEQLEKAKQRFFEKFKYTDPQAKDELLRVFERIKSDAIDADLIYNELLKAHLVINADKYVQLEEKISQLSGGAEEFIKNQSSMAFKGVSQSVLEEEIELTPEDYEAMKFAGIPESLYRRLKKEGKI
jgi:DNA repair exonuclease SbcCD ATPase subunit